MKYLKDFSTESDYQTFKGGGDWATPNVSFINKDKRIFYNKKSNIFYTLQTIYNIKTSHQALPGMTWDDWVNSEYYTASSDGYFSNESGFVRIEDSILKNSNGESVYMTDTIISGETYTYKGNK